MTRTDLKATAADDTMAPNPGAAIAADKPNVEDDPLAGAVLSDPKSTPMPAGLLNPSSLAAPAELLSSHATQSLVDVASVPPVDTPADVILERDEPRFISRQALGGPGSQIPIASLPFASDGLFGGETPFAGRQEELGWTTDDIEGIPNGLPNLVRALFGDQAPSARPVEASLVAPQTPEDVAVADLERSDVFALPDLDEDPDWSDEEDEDEDEDEGSELPEDPVRASAAEAPAAVDETAALRADLDKVSGQRWLFAGLALLIGLAVGALLG